MDCWFALPVNVNARTDPVNSDVGLAKSGFAKALVPELSREFKEFGYCLNLKILSAVLGVPLRPLRLSCVSTQRTLRYAEEAEKTEQLRHLRNLGIL